MRFNPKLATASDRRTQLFFKNKYEGLTEDEIVEFKKATRCINNFIKHEYPDSWKLIKSGRRRTKFKRI